MLYWVPLISFDVRCFERYGENFGRLQLGALPPDTDKDSLQAMPVERRDQLAGAIQLSQPTKLNGTLRFVTPRSASIFLIVFYFALVFNAIF